MKICTVDLETFWSTTHSLRKMSPITYCMHPDTEIISCAFKFDDGPTEVVFGESAVIEYAKTVDWSQYWVVAHNLSGFDSMILSWRMGVKPKLWGCTLAMARPIHAKDVGLSLEKLVEHYKLGRKDQSVLLQTKGRHLCDFTEQEVADMRVYNAKDVDQCYALLQRLIKLTRRDEVKIIDMTIRMLVEPKLESDTALLEKTSVEEGVRKKDMLVRASKILSVYDALASDDENAEVASKTLSSSKKFVSFLESLGVSVPTKISPTTGKEIPALAKTDEGYTDLQEHENPIVAAAVNARLDAKSTLLQTRIQKFLAAVDAHPESKLPIPLKYCGADTTGRWSGWIYNPQNLPRVNPNNPRPSDALRYSIIAPKGHKVVVSDLSGIELRVNHFLWKVPSSMAMFQADPGGADLYKDFAGKLYYTPFDDVTKDQRQIGKVSHLGLGFNAGWSAFMSVAKQMGGIDLPEDESRDIVDRWRSEYPEIVGAWRTCQNALPTIMRGAEGKAVDPWGMVYPTAEGFKTPKGLIRYPNLRTKYNEDNGHTEFVYGPKKEKKIYGGKSVENIVQHLAREVLAGNALDVQRLTGFIPAHTIHDEFIYVVPDSEAEYVLDTVQQVMRTPPAWWPELVTWSEGGIADSYGDAK